MGQSISKSEGCSHIMHQLKSYKIEEIKEEEKQQDLSKGSIIRQDGDFYKMVE